MIVNSHTIEKKSAMAIAELMAVAARTAPKGKGTDNLEILIVDGEDKDKLAYELESLKEKNNADFFLRDSHCVNKAEIVLLMGTKVTPIDCPDCGFCGYENCEENVANNGICAFAPGDLGIAIGSAVSVASNHRCDNRVMFSVGRAALNLNFFCKDVRIAYGIPLSISGKSPFFDR